MAHTREQRDRFALCGAKKKNGDICRAWAGMGTNHPGIGRCRYHLGNTASHQQNAVKVEAQRELAKVGFGVGIEMDPAAALLSMVHLSAGHLRWVKDQVEANGDKTGFDAQVLMRMYDEERERLARFSKAALDAGVAERTVRLAETYGAQLADYTRGILDDLWPFLSAAGQAEAESIVRRRILALGTGEVAGTVAA
jgi:hypothetical protein